MSQLNTTRTIPSSSAASMSAVIPHKELEGRQICIDRFKWVILSSVIAQYLILMVFSIVLNISNIHPVMWFKELFSIIFSSLTFVTVLFCGFSLNSLLKEKIYQPTRFRCFISGIAHNSTMLVLNIFIGFLTSRMLVRYLPAEYQFISNKSEEKMNSLNENCAFLLLNGAFIRLYHLYFKRPCIHQCLEFPIIYQSKLLQVRRLIMSTISTAFKKSILPTFHFVGFYIIFRGTFYCLLRYLFMLNLQDTSLWESFTILFNVRLLIYSYILASLVYGNIMLMTQLIEIFTTQPYQFPIENSNSLTLADALVMTKFPIIQQLAAQDLNQLADSPNGIRRNEFYKLSNPGAHPNNWKQLVKSSLMIIDCFAAELKKSIEGASKNNNNIIARGNLMQPIMQFYENKRLTRDFNSALGVRPLAASSPLISQPQPIKNEPDIGSTIKNKFMSNRFIFYFFGEMSDAKLNFLLTQQSQTVVWIVQGLAAIVARSILEDKYGVVQHDIKQILKSFILLKKALDGITTVNAKDRNFIVLKAAVRRSLYRIVIEFSCFFEDMLLDFDDIVLLKSFDTFREL